MRRDREREEGQREGGVRGATLGWREGGGGERGEGQREGGDTDEHPMKGGDRRLLSQSWEGVIRHRNWEGRREREINENK